MKKFPRAIVVFSIFVLMVALTACGGDDGSKTTAGGGGGEAESQGGNSITANKTGIFELEGTVSKINTISNTFVLETAEGDVEVEVRAMSRVMLNGERVALSMIKSGSTAKGTFKKFNGNDAVKEIVITP